MFALTGLIVNKVNCFGFYEGWSIFQSDQTAIEQEGSTSMMIHV